MSGIYIHIPFCKQACHYCDFHFSTSMAKRGEMLVALQRELEIRKDEFNINDTEKQVVETIYFGGGTPSVLTSEEISEIIETVYKYYKVAENAEITLEVNPDDLTSTAERSQSSIFKELKRIGINRLSIGVQSFFEEDLKLMNRAHNAQEAVQCISEARKYFKNISIDLIYGIPAMSDAQWQQNIEKALAFNIPHISSYALTVEPKTALAHMVKKGEVANVDDEAAERQFHMLVATLEQHGYVHYEVSNFGKEGYFSRNNSAYWQGKKYMGIGPSAHSFNGHQRGWNVKNNLKYIKAIQEGNLPFELEILTTTDRYNEYIMTGLRTVWGVSVEKIEREYGKEYSNYVLKQVAKPIAQKLLVLENGILKVTQKGKFLVDGLASDLFMV